MTSPWTKLIYWTPRALSIALILFVSMFALDVFEGRSFWPTLVALLIHLIPSYILIGFLILAWRWEWIGAVLFTVAGLIFFLTVRSNWFGKALFTAPSLLIALLFLLNWLNRKAKP